MTSFDALLPAPLSVLPVAGRLVLDGNTTLGGEPAGVLRWLRGQLGASTGLPLSPATEAVITFRLASSVDGPEGYRLRIDRDGVLVEASDEAGAFYAAQTLRQLLGAPAFRAASVHNGLWILPCGVVVDRPRFGWRGCLLDVARHFLPKDGILRFVDLLAAHKLNVLHLHLTDDQGWRFEVSRYPKLVEVGAWRTASGVGPWQHGVTDHRPHGGYYSRTDLAEIVAYAAERHITVVPEVDVPGHTQAAIAAYPELGEGPEVGVWTRWGINSNVLNVNESTVDFFRNVFDEVVDVFPGEVICVGGDEVPLDQWRASPHAQRRMVELGLGKESELHAWFIGQLASHLADRGRRAMGWDEIAEVGGLTDGVVVASWRGEEAGVMAARAGYDVVMCPEGSVYLDHRQSERPDEPIPVGYVRTLRDVYRYEPMPAGLTGGETGRVLGAQAQVWTEHLDSARRVDYAAFPRLSAFAEAVWRQPGPLDDAGFLRRLVDHHLPRLDALGVEYRPLTGPHPWQTRPGVRGWPV